MTENTSSSIMAFSYYHCLKIHNTIDVNFVTTWNSACIRTVNIPLFCSRSGVPFIVSWFIGANSVTEHTSQSSQMISVSDPLTIHVVLHSLTVDLAGTGSHSLELEFRSGSARNFFGWQPARAEKYGSQCDK